MTAQPPAARPSRGEKEAPLLIEFPCGWLGRPPKHEDLLEMGTAVLDEVFCFGNRYRFRPYGPYEAQ